MMFEGARQLRFQGLDLVILGNAAEHRAELSGYHDDLLRLATLARGWELDAVPHMRRVFKLEPFYRATSMVLIFNHGQLCGTAGVDTDFAAAVPGSAIVHLCSLNLLEALKHSGVVGVFMLLLRDELLASLPPRQPVYFTSISQSPLVYRLLARLGHVYPNDGETPPEDVRQAARAVTSKYDPGMELDEDGLVLRGECAFFYKNVPYVADRRINALFDARLDMALGDVFVNVGKTRVDAARDAIDRYRRRIEPMMEAA
jgi:hypothetical protein